MTTDDDRDDVDRAEGYVPSVGDVVRRWRYTLTPTLYTDETSDTSELLWQQVLELRANRGWLVLLLLGQLVGTVVLTLALLGVLGR